ncbi:MAG: hypothetical protein M1817_005101 [Caeruleum heppii]|nr:MAG: hypothetical protein M1817_005101 [Caeruleum heppii]
MPDESADGGAPRTLHVPVASDADGVASTRDGSEEEERAAGTIQRNYRGYRARRQLQGIGLDPSTRWAEAIKEARYRNLNRPRARSERLSSARLSQDGRPVIRRNSTARQNWQRLGVIARRAGGDDTSESSEEDEQLSAEQKQEAMKKKAEQKRERAKSAKMMDLQYFLEMVDLKHRYGSNLHAYHDEWKRSSTQENFFYWLDHGEGRRVDLQICPRERLEREQVRYLSREERQHYLVEVDKDGRLCWAKNGERIDTSVRFRDSVNGSPTEGRRHSSSSSSTASSGSDAGGDHYVGHPPKDAKASKRMLHHVSAATVLNHLLRKSVRKNTWIFVADTSFRLYVGIKQSGAFQHSSFLQGSRISAAGTIKIKDGQLRSLSPLSGHYRAPTSSFTAFVHSLKALQVDTSRVSISKSYTVLVGLETYLRVKKKVRHAVRGGKAEEGGKKVEDLGGIRRGEREGT